MSAPFKWAGSKALIAADVIAALPEHNHYVEVFAGSAAVLFAKPRSPLETINDVDHGVINLFTVLRDPTAAAELVRQLELTLFSRDELNLARTPTEDPVEAARRFILVSFQGLPGRAGWAHNMEWSSTATWPSKWLPVPRRVARCVDRLVGVQIESADWRVILDRYDRPGNCLFADPPYHHDVRPNSPDQYGSEFAEADHLELVAALRGLEYASAVVTHYPHPIYDALGWQHVDAGTYARVVSGNTGRAKRVDRIYTSHPPATGRLF